MQDMRLSNIRYQEIGAHFNLGKETTRKLIIKNFGIIKIIKEKKQGITINCSTCGKCFHQYHINSSSLYYCSKECRPEKDIEYIRNRNRIRSRNYYNTEKGRKIIKKINKKFKLKFKEKTKARAILRYAVIKGKIIKPLICSECKVIPLRMEAHHIDYSQPLKIIWLCTACHNKTHRVK